MKIFFIFVTLTAILLNAALPPAAYAAKTKTPKRLKKAQSAYIKPAPKRGSGSGYVHPVKEEKTVGDKVKQFGQEFSQFVKDLV